MRAAVQADERLAEHGELHRQFLASPGRRIVVRRRVARADMAVGEGRGIEFGGLAGFAIRSEEHTSELQSLMRISYAVFCLKKKKFLISVYMKLMHDLLTYFNRLHPHTYNYTYAVCTS